METVRSLEKTIAEWYKNVPHLPPNVRKWLGDNVWWIVVIGVVLSALSLFALIPLTLLALGLSTATVAGLPGAYGYVGGGVMGIAWLTILLSLITLVITTALLALAISPLKSKAKKGWTILFVITLASAVLGVLGNLVSFNIGGIVWTAIWAALEGYFLFEIHNQFGKTPAKVATAPVKK